MRHLGDITKIRGELAPRVEVIIGGSPCQDLSVAGKRAGLAGERSGLFMDQIRVIKEMRKRDIRAGRSGINVFPRYMVWENVPGAFSSNGGKDFRAVLEETARVVEQGISIPRYEGGRWTNAGTIIGDHWSIAWRTHDAQYWGVPQRRRRISLVADFGGLTAPEILFERKSLCGDPQESREEGKRTAGDSAGSPRQTVGFTNRGYYSGDIAETLRSDPHGAYPMIARTLTTRMDGGPGPDRGSGTQIVVQSGLNRSGVLAFKLGNGDKARGIGLGYELAPTLNAECGGNKPAICIQGNCIGRSDTAGCDGKGWNDEDVCFTLNTIDRPAVFDARGNGDGRVVPTITGDHGNRVTDYTALCVGNGQADNTKLHEKAPAPSTMHDQQAVMIGSVVRRLTPLECERLQGYPDGWTDIGDWTDSKGKLRKQSDSNRYKALGNSIALPFWAWMLNRMNGYCQEHTMASLFDGIGGFPLIWERLNGRGSCLWASEIEEYPIAVTKYHFNQEGI